MCAYKRETKRNRKELWGTEEIDERTLWVHLIIERTERRTSKHRN